MTPAHESLTNSQGNSDLVENLFREGKIREYARCIICQQASWFQPQLNAEELESYAIWKMTSYDKPINNPEAFAKKVVRIRIYELCRIANKVKLKEVPVLENIANDRGTLIEDPYDGIQFDLLLKQLRAICTEEEITILIYKYLHHYSWKEIANTRNISEGNAKKRGSRLRKKIIKAFDKDSWLF